MPVVRAHIGKNWGRVLDDRETAKRSRRYGVAGIIVIIIVLVIPVVAFLNPLGEKSYTANATHSGGVRSGDDVRIAGVPVGEVTSVKLAGNLVQIKFNVKDSVFVGSESTLEVRLLTPVGGHYVALNSQGAVPLGQKVIPPGHVKAAFETSDLIQSVTPLVKDVNGKVLHDTFTEVANAANKYPNALREIVHSANELTRFLSKMSDDVDRGLGFVNDAVSSLTANREHLLALIGQFALVGRGYTSRAVDIIEFFTLLSELTRIVDRIMVFYSREVAPSVNGIDDIFDTLFTNPDRIGRAADGLGQILNIVVPMLSGNGVAVDDHFLVPGQDLCLPNLMRHC